MPARVVRVSKSHSAAARAAPGGSSATSVDPSHRSESVSWAIAPPNHRNEATSGSANGRAGRVARRPGYPVFLPTDRR